MAAPNPAIAVGVVPYSEPPATITSASPYWIMRAARPMLWVEVVQAVTTAMLGPLKPYVMDSTPLIMLTMEPGM